MYIYIHFFSFFYEKKLRITVRDLVYNPLRASETGTDTCVLVLENFSPPAA